MSKEFRNYLLGRIFPWTTMTLVALYMVRDLPDSVLFLSVILLFEILVSLAVLWNRDRKLKEGSWYIAIGVLDLLGITAFVHFTGGIKSDFLFLYALPIAGLGLLKKAPTAFLWGTLSSLFLGSLVYLEYVGFLPIVTLGGTSSVPVGYPILRISLYTLFYIIVGAFVTFLREDLKRKSLELDRAKKELHQLELDTYAILNNIPSGILAIEKNGEVLFSNFAAHRILDLDERFDLAILKEKVPEFAQELLRILREPCDAQRREIIIKGSKGEKRPIGFNHTYLFHKDGEVRGLIVVFQDLTEIKELEWELRRRDRLAAIGEFSAHLAHEIRNPLTALRGSVELLRELHVDQEEKKLMSLILKESDRLNRIVSDFLQFARISKPKEEAVDLPNVLLRVVDWARQVSLLNKKVEIVSEVKNDETIIRGDSGQIEMVFTNLFQNAIDAIPDKGRIVVCMAKGGERLMRLDQGKMRVPDGRVAVQIRDTGIGLDEETMNHIFEPFFTTKREGTGLGLSIVQKIVTHHKGEIRVESKRGGGTVFTVFFPEANEHG